MKILTFLASNLGRLHQIDAKITAFYEAWRTIFDKVGPLLPQHVAATAAVAAAQEEAAEPVPESVQVAT
jgi:hypothetical protein